MTETIIHDIIIIGAGLAGSWVLNRSLSPKQKGSRNRRKTRYLLARAHSRIDDKQRHFHYETAHELCKKYDVLVFEDLNIDGMKRLWRRKVSDLAFS